jgi:hypothetical protein
VPAGFERKWPPDAEVKALIGELGVPAAAKRLGVPPSSLRSHAVRQGLPTKSDQIGVKVKAAEKAAEAKPVDHPDRIALQRAKDEIKVLRKDTREYAEKLASQHEFFEQIVEATRVSVQVPKFRTKRQGKSKPSNSVILPAFDMQFGQFVRPSDTPGGQGSFSEAIFDERLARWVNASCEIVAARAENYTIEELIFVLGGDQVEGDEIFPGQAWQLEMGPPRQVWELTLKLEAALKEIIRFAKEQVGIKWIAVYCVPGNHGKVGGRKSGARPSDYSWDWLHHMMLVDRLRAEPVDQFAIEPAGSLFFYCAGHEFQAIHGDEIRGWGGIPFYGLTRFDSRSMRLHNRIYRYLLMGHHHQAGEIPNGAGETIISGDWVGANNLSGVITAASRPQQKLLFVSHKWGIDGTERIYFAEADEAYTPTAIHGNAA